jgi:hypothetical protein
MHGCEPAGGTRPLVALILALGLFAGAQQGWAQASSAPSPGVPRYDVNVFPFQVSNASQGPAVQPRVLAEWLLEDVNEVDSIRWAHASMDIAGFAPRYQLEGTVSWVGENAAGDALMDCSFILTAVESGQQVGKNIHTNLTIEQASQSVFELLTNVSGRLRVESNQLGSEVLFNGQWVGTTPFDSTGVFHDRYEITLRHPSRTDKTVTVVFTDAERTSRVDMLDLPTRVHIVTKPGLASVYVNGYLEGQTPLDLEFPTGGTYELELTDGKKTHYRRLVVEDHQEYTVEIDMESGAEAGDAILRKARWPFQYADAHFGLTYSLGVPENDRFRDVIERAHTAGVNAGLCASYFRLNVAGYYGWTEYGGSEGGQDLTFLDGAGEEATIDGITRAGVQGELCLTLPVGRTAKATAHYPFAGIGYSFDNVRVKVKDAWTRTDGTTVDAGETMNLTNNHPYWTVGVVFFNFKLQYRKSFEAERTDWSEFSIGIQTSIPR